MDFFNKHFGFVYNPLDDTATRSTEPSTTAEAHNSLPNQTIFAQDIPLNPTHNTSLRLYTPITPTVKLPLIVYYHGGGFIMGTVFDTIMHDFCTSMVTALSVVVLAAGYRLAPENRLPAAFEDGVEAILWAHDQALMSDDTGNRMLKEAVDFSKCYVMGSSAGGNLAYNAGLRALCHDLGPLVIRGCILDHPFFGGQERSDSELRLGAADGVLPLDACDFMWELSLPKGCDRDREYCNPLVEGSYKDKIGMMGRFFVNTHSGDILVGYGLKLVEMLEGMGVSVVNRFQEGGAHCIEHFDPEEAKGLFSALKEFVS